MKKGYEVTIKTRKTSKPWSFKSKFAAQLAAWFRFWINFGVHDIQIRDVDTGKFVGEF